MTYAYSYHREGPWKGSYKTRALAEEAAREGTFNFVMVWTAVVRKLKCSDLLTVNRIFEMMLNEAYEKATSDYVSNWSLYDANLDDYADDLRALIDSWADKHGLQPQFSEYTDIEPGWYAIDYTVATSALNGGDAAHSSDGPVMSETHYMALVGRAARFSNRTKRVDLAGVPLDDRIARMDVFMGVWDAEFPLPGLRRYERRIREIKDVLRSPWLSDQTPSYAYLQRELQWLKFRVTLIYGARHRASRPDRSLSDSETPTSTEARIE